MKTLSTLSVLAALLAIGFVGASASASASGDRAGSSAGQLSERGERAESQAYASGRRTHRIRSAKRRRGTVVFEMRQLRGKRIVAGRIKVGRRERRLSLRRVRRAARRGRLVVRPAPARQDTRPSAPVRGPGNGSRPALIITTVPAPPPIPAPPAGNCAFGTFGVGSWPGACWRPYASSSPFNRLIPASPRLHPNSDAFVRRVVGWGTPNNIVAGDAEGEDDWGHPTFYASPTDPEFTVHCVQRWGRCSIEGHRIRVPDAARPAGGGDAHMTIVDQRSGWEYDLWQVRTKQSGGGRLEASWGGRTRIDGDGLDSDATASKFGNLGGIIRAQEWQAGEINHALFMVINCDSGDHVYPAKKSGRPCTDIGESNAGAPPMGARFQLNLSVAQIDALPVPPWKKTLLRAMARYGMYFGDTGGGSWGVQAESGTTYTSLGHKDPLVTFGEQQGVPTWNGKRIFNVRDGVDWARHLRVVDPCEAQAACG